MNKVNFEQGDDLSDFLGQPSEGPRPLPQAPEYVRIRQEVPVFEERCKKCGGSGTFRSYSGRALGSCFACKGKGKKVFATAPEVRAQAKTYREALPGKRWDAFQANHPAEAAFLVAKLANPKLPEGYRTVLVSIKEAIDRYGDTLSEGRMAVLERGVARDAEFAANRVNRAAEQQEQVKGIDVANIVNCFQKAQEAGLQRFTLRFSDCHFQVDKHDAGLIWVSRAGYGTEKYGRITGGVYRPGRDLNSTVLARIALISADPMAAARAYAQQTASCSVCGKHLENEVSVDEGIGPICAGRLGYKPGKKFVEIAKGDF